MTRKWSRDRIQYSFRWWSEDRTCEGIETYRTQAEAQVAYDQHEQDGHWVKWLMPWGVDPLE